MKYFNYVNIILKAIEFFVKKLEERVAVYESKAIAIGAQIEQLEETKKAHFTEAIRARKLATKFRV